MISEQELAEIRARAETAKAGLYSLDRRDPDVMTLIDPVTRESERIEIEEAESNLILFAQQDIKRLLDEADRLRQELSESEKYNEYMEKR